MGASNSSEFNSQNMYVPFEGTICNKNTIEQFKECDKMDIINAAGAKLSRSIVSGEALERPSILNSFLILSFAVSLGDCRSIFTSLHSLILSRT